ncbi:MAG: translocation/assembly module TamB domain-containing protein [Proteobacteria bacterium]|nr:translocation/assembly module TamB domain-containing protein [Pseudomonadota bacterium]
MSRQTPDENTPAPQSAPKRRRLRRILVAFVALALLAAIGLLWLLNTASGRDFALHQLVARLPTGSTLQWKTAQGDLAGPLVLQGVDFMTPVQRNAHCKPTLAAPCATDPLRLQIEHLRLDPALLPLLARRLRFDTLAIRGVQLDLPRDDTPLELPRWPDLLPTLDLPLTVQADALVLDDVRIAREGEALIAVRSVRGGLRVGEGALHVEQLRIDCDRGVFSAHGDYAPRDNFRTDLTASAQLPANLGQAAPALNLRVHGDLSNLQATAEGRLPGVTRLNLTLSGDTTAPHWQLQASSEGLDPDVFMGHTASGTPLRFSLATGGTGGSAELRGSFSDGDFTAQLQPSKLRINDQRIDLQPLVVDLLDGRVTVNGHVELKDSDQASVALALAARGLRWSDVNGRNLVAGDADLNLTGRLDQWMLRGQARLARDQNRASVDLTGSGDRNGMRLQRFDAGTNLGKLSATGMLAWSPALRWQADANLRDFDPGNFLPDWPGALRGRITSSGEQRNGALTARFDARDLGGQLRGRPLTGHAQLAIDAARYSGELALTLGGSKIEAKGRVDTTLVVDARFDPLRLDDVLPGASGHMQGHLSLRGKPTMPDLRIDLQGQSLVYRDFRASALQLHGELPWSQGDGTLSVEAADVHAGVALASLHANLRGALSRLVVELDARGEAGVLNIAGSARQTGTRWQGQLTRLSLAPTQGSAWALRSPSNWAWDGHAITIGDTCLQATLGGSLCGSGAWPRAGIALKGDALPLALLADWLPARADGRRWSLDGTLDLDAHIASAALGWAASASVQSTGGGLRSGARARRVLFGYRDLKLALQANPQRIEGELAAALSGGGSIDAQLATGWDAASVLTGSLRANTKELTWLELLSPDLAEPGGLLALDVQLSGSRVHPRLGGSARLQAFSAELPALGIGIEQGEVELQAREDGSASIRGSANTGKGTLQIEGSLGWLDDTTPLQVSIRGSEVLLADTRQLRLLASPDMTVRWRSGTPVEVRGEVLVPEADLHLERLQSGVAPSPDVVVLDPDKPTSAATPLAVDLDLGLRVGDKVRIDGYGLTGSLSGKLRVRQPPGGETRATGALEVGGRYRAYGQNLQITRGTLAWSNSPIGDPRLDIRAERHVGDVVAGVAVGGRASAPHASVYSNPAMSQSEALAYLTLGRPLSTLNGREAQQLGAARSALNAGAGLLAAELGNRIGLDDAGVSQSRALGGEVLGIGKYLSPRLYVSYGVALLGTGQVVTLKYLLKKGFDIQIESSSVQNRASVNWRMEK